MQNIMINNWEKFQHYKDRRPTWVKLLIEIIEEYDADGNPKKYYPMPDNAKTTLLHLLCLRANYNEKIPYPNDRWLRKRLGLRRITLQPLVDAGFIVIDTDSVSKPYQVATESAHQRESKRQRESKSICPDLFDKFWKEYPRKEAKQRAIAWFEKNNPTEEDVQKMIYTIQKQIHKGGRLYWGKAHREFVPLPATWLNDGDWRDAPTQKDLEKQVEEKTANELQALEKKRQEIRSEYSKYYQSHNTKQLQDMCKSNAFITHRWLIKEIIAKRKGGK